MGAFEHGENSNVTGQNSNKSEQKLAEYERKKDFPELVMKNRISINLREPSVIPPHTEEGREQEIEINPAEFTVHPPQTEGAKMHETEGVVGAGNCLRKRRKPAFVKRFIHEQTGGNVQRCRTMSDDDTSDTLCITKIIRLLSITSCESGLHINFKAMRSDGQVVMIDDKHLKATNPLMLIEFYEQHMKYNDVEGCN